jgi:hypothetical protein
MSDVAQGPNWWIASDGKWYPPEQHPSVREQNQAPPAGVQTPASNGRPANNGAKVGPQFPDLFKVAMTGSVVADAVTVNSQDPHEHRPVTYGGGGSATLTSTPAGSSSGSSKWKWRKAR